jgi:hypothetical protein
MHATVPGRDTAANALARVRLGEHRPLFGRSVKSGYSGGQDVSTQPGDEQPNYRDLQTRARRHERWRQENLRRIVELQRERHLHLLQTQGVGIGENDLE